MSTAHSHLLSSQHRKPSTTRRSRSWVHAPAGRLWCCPPPLVSGGRLATAPDEVRLRPW